MKNIVRYTLLSLVSVSAIAALLSGCGKSPNPRSGTNVSQPPIVSVEKNSFTEVTSQLNPGGNMYIYLSTEQWMKELHKGIQSLGELVHTMPNIPPSDGEKIDKGIKMLSGLVDRSGMTEVSGFGMSSIEKEKGMYYTRSVLHHYPGQNKGYLWTAFGSRPHALEGLHYLPANTCMATFFDLDLTMMAGAIQTEINQSGFPDLVEGYKQWPEMFLRGTGITWEQFLNSMDSEIGMVITLDPTKMVSMPTPNGGSMEFPTPDLMLVFKVKNDTIFKRVDEVLKGNPAVASVNEGDLRMRTMPLPIPLPIALRPTLAQSGNYLFLATTETIIQNALAVKSGKKPGLTSTETFKKVSKDFPAMGNSFSYTDPSFSKMILDIQKQAMAGSPTQAAPQEWIQKHFGVQNSIGYCVNANTDSGFVSTSYGSQDPSKMVLLAPVAGTAVMAGVLAPALTKARANAREIRNNKADHMDDGHGTPPQPPVRINPSTQKLLPES